MVKRTKEGEKFMDARWNNLDIKSKFINATGSLLVDCLLLKRIHGRRSDDDLENLEIHRFQILLTNNIILGLLKLRDQYKWAVSFKRVLSIFNKDKTITSSQIDLFKKHFKIYREITNKYMQHRNRIIVHDSSLKTADPILTTELYDAVKVAYEITKIITGEDTYKYNDIDLVEKL